jgi:hypothetical protein
VSETSGIFNIVEDTTPQLGGALDVQGFAINTSVGNGDITITPNGTGNLVLGNFTLDADQIIGAGQDKYVMTYDNASGLISLELTALLADTTPQLGGNLDVNGNIITTSVSDGDIVLTPNGLGNVVLGNLTIDGDQTVGAGQDMYHLAYNDTSGLVSLTAPGTGTPNFKSYSAADLGLSGTFYLDGFYNYAVADATLTMGGTETQVFGSANESHAAHAFIVAAGAGGTDLVLTVSGISITDAGVRTPGDFEIIVADTDAAVTDQYFETSKKWLGQITYTLTGSSGSFTFNYGLVKYEDFGNRNFDVSDFEVTGHAGASESGLNVELLHHEATAFTYHATAFVPNQTAAIAMATDHGADVVVAAGDNFAYKRAAIPALAIAGAASEGTIIRVTTSSNNSINYLNAHIGVTLT